MTAALSLQVTRRRGWSCGTCAVHLLIIDATYMHAGSRLTTLGAMLDAYDVILDVVLVRCQEFKDIIRNANTVTIMKS